VLESTPHSWFADAAGGLTKERQRLGEALHVRSTGPGRRGSSALGTRLPNWGVNATAGRCAARYGQTEAIRGRTGLLLDSGLLDRLCGGRLGVWWGRSQNGADHLPDLDRARATRFAGKEAETTGFTVTRLDWMTEDTPVCRS
jgi:hypothetical protein